MLRFCIAFEFYGNAHYVGVTFMGGDQTRLVEAALVVPTTTTTMDGRIVTDPQEEEDESKTLEVTIILCGHLFMVGHMYMNACISH